MTRIEKLQKIVNEGQYAKVEGLLMDVYTAQHILKCYEVGNDRTKKIIENARIEGVATIALRMGKVGKKK
jgi:hypothetical protein